MAGAATARAARAVTASDFIFMVLLQDSLSLNIGNESGNFTGGRQ
ncbi:protein of unknown function [Shinella sp. WSC3-e]|nr:protein of unknown function [Shinella sp. WSC3-e]